MSGDSRKARDLKLLDAIDGHERIAGSHATWRVVRTGRDPLQGAASRSRWCNDSFDVLYTSLERNGALAEIHALLSNQPFFPSKITSSVHRISVRTQKTLVLDDLTKLARLGVDIDRYRERSYGRTQEIADAAFFLGFDSLLVPSARWTCLSLVVFSDRITPVDLILEESEPDTIDWNSWRKQHRR